MSTPGKSAASIEKGAEKNGGSSRREFVRQMGRAAAATLAVSAVGLEKEAHATGRPRARADFRFRRSSAFERAQESYQIRVEAAQAERAIPVPPHPANNDERLFESKIGNYSKGLPHNSIGEVEPAAYSAFFRAVQSGNPDHWDAIPLGGTTPLTNPQAGLAFDLQGTDSHQLAIPPAPPVSSAQRAGEMVEDYWMALLRDIPFTAFESNPLVQSACAELSRLSDFRGPTAGGRVTPRTLFRGFTRGDLFGPYVSQFFLKPIHFGALPITQQYQTYVAGIDYMTDQSSWLAAQNGQGPFAAPQVDSQVRYLRNPRDLAAWVHIDVLYQAYFNAALYLLYHGARTNPGNPYVESRNQTGFGTFGPPHIAALLSEVATRALKAIWYQKWFVHRNLRPEAFGGLVHMANTGQARYPLHAEVLRSEAANRVFVKTGSWFLPMAFPEGSPTHPSYGAGHATVAGACVTILKAFFDDTVLLVDIGDGQAVQPSEDGWSLLPYTGADASQLTVWGELNKLAANVGIGRNMAGVHWRSDYQDSLVLGEAVAISILRDQAACYNENFEGFTFHKFDGRQVTV